MLPTKNVLFVCIMEWCRTLAPASSAEFVEDSAYEMKTPSYFPLRCLMSIASAGWGIVCVYGFMAKNSGQGEKNSDIMTVTQGALIYSRISWDSAWLCENAESEAIHASLSNVILYGFMWTQTANWHHKARKPRWKWRQGIPYRVPLYLVNYKYSWRQVGAHNRPFRSSWMTW